MIGTTEEYHRIMLEDYRVIVSTPGFKPWFRQTAKCIVRGCDSPKQQDVSRPNRTGGFFCAPWYARHVLATL